MPLPPIPTPHAALAPAATSNALTGVAPSVILNKLKLLQEQLNEMQQQLSDLVDEIAKSGIQKP